MRDAVTTFRNPVIRGVAPDPSICRVGDDFYLATSSFDFWPGIPIHHSTDLVHWELIGHAVTRPDQVWPGGDSDSPFNLFAPTLRYHEGTFYVACTNASPRDPELGLMGGIVGNFVVHTDDPAGEWSTAAWVDHQGFDPSLTFADGTCYYARRTLDFRDPAKGLGPIVQGEINPRTGEILRPLQPITPGYGGFESNDIEGPHLYKIGDVYYLFSAEGGTERGHMQTIARSASPYGPFEPAPHNPVLTHRHLTVQPIQCTGHADLVEGPDGTWWAVFLATRQAQLQGPHLLGRETWLAPVAWRDGWPIIGDAGTVSFEQPSPEFESDAQPMRSPDDPWLDGWSTRGFPLEGIAIANAGAGDTVTLPPSGTTLDGTGRCSAAFLRQLEFEAGFTATLAEVPRSGNRAGITVYASPDHHFDCFVERGAHGPVVKLRRFVADLEHVHFVSVPDGPVTLEATCDGSEYRFDAIIGAERITVGTGSAHLLDVANMQGFRSIRFGVFHNDCWDVPQRFDDVRGVNAG
jgi:alpha-N-arabinofuranosidase